MAEPSSDTPELNTIVGLFYRNPAELATFEEVASAQMARDYRMLLAHQDHMTVTVERYHGCLVGVDVLQTEIRGDLYARKLVLRRQSDRAVVMFGIMRLNFAYVSDEIRRLVESQTAPLGRILIEHNVLRDVHLAKLWKVTPGPDLQARFGLPVPVPTYGRTALIDCDGEPAIELLEIVTPLAEILEGLGIRG